MLAADIISMAAGMEPDIIKTTVKDDVQEYALEKSKAELACHTDFASLACAVHEDLNKMHGGGWQCLAGLGVHYGCWVSVAPEAAKGQCSIAPREDAMRACVRARHRSISGEFDQCHANSPSSDAISTTFGRHRTTLERFRPRSLDIGQFWRGFDRFRATSTKSGVISTHSGLNRPISVRLRPISGDIDQFWDKFDLSAKWANVWLTRPISG